ncbi:hypothetical protein [Rhodococcus koreensis]
MTENPGTRTLLNVGDRVMVHPEGVSVFSIVEIEDDHARIESVIDSPRKISVQRRVEVSRPAES